MRYGILRSKWGQTGNWSIRGLSIALHAACIILLLPLLYTALFNHPAGADDYKYSQWGNFLLTWKEHYLRGGGRYFGALMVMLSPLHWRSMDGYRIACLLLLLLFLWSFYRLIRTALNHYTAMPGDVSGAIAAIAVVLMINNMDALSESFFWYSGAVTHMLPAILLAWLLRLFIKTKARPTKLQLSAMIVLCIAIMGGSELTMLLCLAVCFACWVHHKRHSPVPHQRYFAVLLCVCIAFALLAVLSPGNYLKQDRLHRELFMVLPNWLYQTQKFLFRWMLDPVLLSLSALVLAVAQRYPLHRPVTSLLGAFCIPVAIMYLLALPGHLTLGNMFYPRIMSTIYIFFVIGWLFFLLHLSHALKRAMPGRPQALLRQSLLIITFIVLLASFNTHDLRAYNLFTVYKGLAKRIPQQYDGELRARYRAIQAGGDTVMVPRLTTKHLNVLYFLDITPHPAHDQNRHYAKYWRKKAIGLLPDTAAIARPY